jgi:putative membrane protein
MEVTSSRSGSSDRAFYAFNAVLSVVALGVLFYILVVRRGGPGLGMDLRFMPAVNAGLNALSAVLLLTGYVAIRNRSVTLHKYCMVSAFASSSLFLGGYLAYHFVHGDTRFQGTGAVRAVYLLVLASHVLLSMTIVPLALTSLYFSLFKRSFKQHARVARVTLPLWLYVSVTGVLIFFMLRGSPPAVP